MFELGEKGWEQAKKLTIGRSLDGVEVAAGLQNLQLGGSFNQSLDGIVLPAGLQHLQFGDYFNQRLDGVVLPAGLQYLDFGYRFNDSSSKFNDIGDRIGGFSRMVDSPNGNLFSQLLQLRNMPLHNTLQSGFCRLVYFHWLDSFHCL